MATGDKSTRSLGHVVALDDGTSALVVNLAAQNGGEAGTPTNPLYVNNFPNPGLPVVRNLSSDGVTPVTTSNRSTITTDVKRNLCAYNAGGGAGVFNDTTQQGVLFITAGEDERIVITSMIVDMDMVSGTINWNGWGVSATPLTKGISIELVEGAVAGKGGTVLTRFTSGFTGAATYTDASGLLCNQDFRDLSGSIEPEVTATNFRVVFRLDPVRIFGSNGIVLNPGQTLRFVCCENIITGGSTASLDVFTVEFGGTILAA